MPQTPEPVVSVRAMRQARGHIVQLFSTLKKIT
jgi:hypothetical protein